MGAEVDWPVFWWWMAGLAAAFVLAGAVAWLLRKRIARWTAPLWAPLAASRMLRSRRKHLTGRRNGHA